jgi:hypothetical protein
VGNLKYMAVADSSEVKVGLAIHRKVETAVERRKLATAMAEADPCGMTNKGTDNSKCRFPE